MQCVDVADQLLAGDVGDAEVDRHIAECASCAHVARGVERVDNILRASLIVEPPLVLQRQLAQLALAAAAPPRKSWWERANEALSQFNVAEWLARPQVIAAQGLAVLMLILSGWQIFGWVSVLQPSVGDVSYAVELVATSPAVAYLGNLQIDLQGLGIWSLVGIVAWLVSEDGWIGRRIASSGLRLP
jgi:hypothetical protein